jgi:FkbM family methyltransferase
LDAVDCTLCENEFGRYAVPLSSKHRPAAQAVLHGGVWERETIDYIRAHADRDVVHAGTYFGDFVPALSAAMAPGRTIYAFEPNSENHACAQWTTLLNALGNVRLQHAALGDASSTRQMQTAQAGIALGGMSRITNAAQGTVGDYEDVTTVRLDDVLPETADIGVLQLDVEGFEEPALTGALGTIVRCRPILILETVPGVFIGSRLVPLGYQQRGVVCGNAIFQADPVSGGDVG